MLGAFFVFGIIFIVIPHLWNWSWDHGIISEIGIALLVASILGFTIDRWLKAELRTDAFLAAIGHILAPEFRAEVARIIGYRLVCEQHFSFVEIEFVEIEHVRSNVLKVTSSSERTIRNKSAYVQPIRNYAHIDEWGYAEGTSKILECILELEGQSFTASAKPSVEGSAFQISTEEKQLKPQQTATLRTRYVEFKNLNDVIYYHYTVPTIDPEIEVRAPDDIECSIGFGTPAETIASRYTIRKKLVGTYFPHQNMSVRWWPKGIDISKLLAGD